MQKEKNPHLFLSLQCWKVSSSACTLQRSSYLPSSVLSAHTRKSEQSKQSSDLHHKLLHVLCCCLALKLKFPAHGHSSCCTFRILPLEWATFSVKYTSGTKLLGNFKMLLDCDTAQSVQIQILSYFPHHISRGFRGAQAPSPPSAPLLLHPSFQPEAAVAPQDGKFPVLSLSCMLIRAGSLRVCTCSCCVRTDNIQPAQAEKLVKGLASLTMYLSKN